VTSYDVRCGALVTSRAAVLWAHKNETIDVITSKDYHETNEFKASCPWSCHCQCTHIRHLRSVKGFI